MNYTIFGGIFDELRDAIMNRDNPGKYWGPKIVKKAERYHEYKKEEEDKVILTAINYYGSEYGTNSLMGFLDFSGLMNGTEGMLLYREKAVLYERGKKYLIDYVKNMSMKIEKPDGELTLNTINIAYPGGKKLSITSSMFNMSAFRDFIREMIKDNEPVEEDDEDYEYTDYYIEDENIFNSDYSSENQSKIVKSHSFEKAKNQINTFSSKTSPSIDFSRVESSGGLFGWFDHKVTGVELNRLAGEVQGYLIGINDLNKNFIDEFRQVYNALDALDKDYIQSILVSIKAAEAADEDAKKAQEDIQKTIKALQETTRILQNHKEKLDRLKHLENVDELWNEIGTVKNQINAEQGQLQRYIGDTSENKRLNEENGKELVRINEELIKIKEQKHLGDIDQMWDKIERINEKQQKKQENLVPVSKGCEVIENKKDTEIAAMSSKLKISYCIAGGAIALSVVQFVLNILGIL